MGAVPSDIDTDRQPPMAVPLRHFVVGLAFLLAGVALGLAVTLDAARGSARLVHLHLLLVGWVCVTIMGAMTQFVPVWSGVALHSKRLAALQLWLVTAGLVGLGVGFLAADPLLVPAGIVLMAGVWTFVYNVGRTLLAVEGYDVTERHFALALVFFGTLAPLGVLLVVSLHYPVLTEFPVTRGGIVGAHATLGVFGAVLTTVLGALYQLGTMFTQTDLRGVDLGVRRFEAVAYPAGVVLLAVGRLVASVPIAATGGLMVAASVLGFAVVLARRLYETRVDRTPMLSRYAVLAGAMAVWALSAGTAWVTDPLSRTALLGAPGTTHLLAIGVVGFAVLGTLYHVVPFIVWVHRYSDLLGFEEVPMVDDLYDDRLAAVDFWAFLAGVGVLVVSDALGLSWPVTALGGMSIAVGAAAFSANLVLVLYRHSPRSVRSLLVGSEPAGE